MSEILERGKKLAREFINITDEQIRMTIRILEELKILQEEYKNLPETAVSELESLKRNLNSKLEHFGTLYAKIKANDDLLEEIRKRVKGKVVEDMVENRDYKVTTADKAVYNDDLYIGALEKIKEISAFTTEVETKYWHYRKMLDLVVQSISVGSKDKEFNRYSKSEVA